MKLKTIEVRGREIEVEVSESGVFFAEVDGERHDAPSLDLLRAKLIRATKKVAISIPFIMWDEGKIRRGVCTGRHGSNRNLLVKWDGQKGSEQVSYWNSDATLSPDHEAAYGLLCEEARRAKKTLEAFEKKHGLDLKALIEEAYRKEGDE